MTKSAKYKLHATYMEEIKYGNFGPKNWRFACIGGESFSLVGPIYPTKELLLADMKEYLRNSWGYKG